jgi:protein-tyrosine phosphatase
VSELIQLHQDLEEAIKKTVKHALVGNNILIHCHAGLGRTGLFVAYLAKRVLGLSSEEAIHLSPSIRLC